MVATLLARAPQGMAPLTLILLTQERTGSLAAGGAASGAWGLGIAVGQPLWARLASRGQAGSLVLRLALGQALVLAALAFVPWSAPVLGVTAAGLAGLLGAPVTSVARTLWPELTDGARSLERLYTLDATAQEVVWIAGPALVGALVAVSGPGAASAVTAAAGAVGAAAFNRAVRPWWRPRTATQHAESFLRALLAPWVAVAIMGAGLGLTEVAIPAVALLAGHRSLAGPLAAGWSLGSVVGGLVAARRPSTADPTDRVVRFWLLLAGTGLLTAATWTIGLGWFAVVLFVAGLGLAPAMAAVYGVVARVAPTARRTEAFAVGSTFLLTGMATGTALGGALAERTPTAALLTAAGCFLAASVGWALWAHRTRSTRPSSQTGPDDS